jgi:hypothetical protein
LGWNRRNWFILNGHGRWLLKLQRSGFKIADVISVGVRQQYLIVFEKSRLSLHIQIKIKSINRCMLSVVKSSGTSAKYTLIHAKHLMTGLRLLTKQAELRCTNKQTDSYQANSSW